MVTSEDLLCECYYDAGYQWNGNGAKREMQRFLSEIFLE